MPILRPFIGLLYDPALAGPFEAVTAPPYDTITPMDQDRYHRQSPYNVVRLILGRGEPGDDESHNKYTRAGTALRAWTASGILRPTPRPSLFPYELRFHHGGRERRIRGLITEVELEDWGGSILPHERTMPGPVEDRLRLIEAAQANLSSVYGVLDGPSAPLADLLDRAMAGAPAVEVHDESGTTHRLWVSGADDEDLRADAAGRTMLIADGHHRYTVALAHRERMRARYGAGPWDAIMMFVVDGAAERPPVLPLHRVVLSGTLPPSPGGPDPRGDRVRDLAEVLASVADEDLTYGTVAVEDGETVHRVAGLDGAPPAVCALHEDLLDRHDLRLGFLPDAVAAEQAVMDGSASIAFILPPTTVERVRAVVGGGGRLPQKSTYFWPKPRTGVVLRSFDVQVP